MADNIPRRRPRQDDSAINEDRTADGPPKSNRPTEDKTKLGWPGVAYTPFVPHSYYEQFPERFRPQFEVSGASENLNQDDARKLDAGWQKPIEHVTLVNVSDKPTNVHILGSQPGEKIVAKVPAAGGIIRGPLRSYLSLGIAGSVYSTFLLIGPSYAALTAPCSDSEEAERRKKTLRELCSESKTKPQRNGERLDACILYDCPVDGHSKRMPNGELESTMSLRHFQYLVEAIGQTLTSKDEKTGEHTVQYTPELPVCKAQLDAVMPLDNRPHAQLFAMNRQFALEEREAKIRTELSEGKFITGR